MFKFGWVFFRFLNGWITLDYIVLLENPFYQFEMSQFQGILVGK